DEAVRQGLGDELGEGNAGLDARDAGGGIDGQDLAQRRDVQLPAAEARIAGERDEVVDAALVEVHRLAAGRFHLGGEGGDLAGVGGGEGAAHGRRICAGGGADVTIGQKLHPSPAVALRAASLARRQAEDSAPLPSTARADCAQARRVSSRNRRAAGCAALSILWMQRASSSRYASQAGTPSAARAPAAGAATAAGGGAGAGRAGGTAPRPHPAGSADGPSRSRTPGIY